MKITASPAQLMTLSSLIKNQILLSWARFECRDGPGVRMVNLILISWVKEIAFISAANANLVVPLAPVSGLGAQTIGINGIDSSSLSSFRISASSTGKSAKVSY